MDYIHALILGLVQGLTEYLPVSSSGHLELGQRILGVHSPDSLTFDITVHVATVFSTLVVLNKEVSWIFKGLFTPLKPTGTPPVEDPLSRFSDSQKYALKILVSMIPIGLVGILAKDWVEAAFNGIHVVPVCLMATAVLLTVSFYIRPREKEDISLKDAFIIGIAQAVAVLPGLSRSGSTIATGLLLGVKKEHLAQFSFLMVIPPILGEALLEGIKLVKEPEAFQWDVLAVGFIAAFISGCLACKVMIALVKKCQLIWFAVYCAIVSLLAFILI
ncbi:MAG: undecaprenyl-diphosphate phosphatase [Bacteroidales bacterium]|nr:undecaprenyl-diphosphate phosphatase [Bacteroidales bacterium]